MTDERLKQQRTWACNCVGPQNGQPKCPCMMRNVIQRNGRWVQVEEDLGPVIGLEESIMRTIRKGWEDA